MIWKIIQWRSLNTRVTIFTLIIFVVSIWSLAFYATRMLREDMQRLLGEQQQTTAAFVAEQINDELSDRLAALELIANQIDAPLMGNRSTLQAHIEQRPILQVLFNGGVFVTGPDGTAIADVPLSTGRIGTNYMDRESVAIPLKEGKTVIGRPTMGKKLGAPIFSMVAPIRDAQGRVIGALVATVNLGKANFLDKITRNRYGKTGGYLLEDAKNRLIITGTDKSRIMQPLPAPGVNWLIDRHVQGFDETGVTVNPKGVEVLASARRIPAAGWFIVASLPTAEAFAPIRDVQQRMLLAAAFLTLLAGALTWWMLRRQLAPLLAASKLLATLPATNQPPQPLPITRQDEIGDLIGGFNRLLETLKQRNAELRESEFRWKFAIEGSGDGVWDWNLQTDHVAYSIRWKEMLGYSDVDILPTNHEWVSRIHPEDQAYVAGAIQAYLEGKTEIYVVEYRLRCKDESYKWILGRGMVVSRSEDGKPLRMIGTHTDITERKQAEEALRESELRFSLFMENLPACAYIKDEQGRHIFVNAALATQTMTTVGSLLGKANGDLWPKDIAAKLDSADAAVITSRSSLTIEEDVLMNNEVRTYLTTKFPIERSNGGTFLAGISLDITERKQAEAELEQHRNHLEKLVFTRTAELTQARDTAEAANRAKTIFLANMSHELRTPMNGIMGMNDIALRQTSEPKIKHYLTRVKSASSKLLAIINDILDISRIEAGQMKLQHVEFKLSRVIENLTNLVGIKADEKGLKLDIKVPTEMENLLLIGDPLRLEQILLNLICNAIKFTSEGAITVSVSLTEDRPKLVALRFAVQDTGIGISEEDQKRIFLPFEQADGSMTRQYGGTGLGLAIGKDLAKLMDGDIGIESKLGAGSTFWLAVRFKKVEEHPIENPITASDAEVLILQRHKGRRVLVVDDDATSQAIAQVQLDGVGLAVDTAESGEEAISMAKQTDYAAILMDIRMANMDGLETTRRIRQLPGRKQTPILALTANAYSEDEERCFDAGMNGFIAKPYDESTLFSTMLKWLDRGAV